MKSNKKLVIVIISLVVLLLLASALAAFLTYDPNRFINKAFKNLGSDSFTCLDIVIKEGKDVVYSDIDDTIYNPLGLNVTEKDKINLNVDVKLIKGEKIQDGDIVKVQGVVKDTKSFLGKEVQDLKVSYIVNIKDKEVETLMLEYKELTYDISIKVYKK